MELNKRLKNKTDVTGYPEAPLAFDAIWAVALAFNKTEERYVASIFLHISKPHGKLRLCTVADISDTFRSSWMTIGVICWKLPDTWFELQQLNYEKECIKKR